MSDTPNIEPNAWFLAVAPSRESGYSAAARTLPGFVAEVLNPETGEWTANQGNLWETLQEDPGWEEVDQSEVDAWVAAMSGSGAPSSTG